MVLILVGTIDRIDGGWAAVEWMPSADIRDVSLSAFPVGIKEGDRVQLMARADPSGQSIARRASDGLRLLTPQGPIGLPDDAPLPTNLRFQVQILKQTQPTRSPGRIHPTMGTREHGSMDLRLFRVGAPVLGPGPERGPAEPADPDPSRGCCRRDELYRARVGEQVRVRTIHLVDCGPGRSRAFFFSCRIAPDCMCSWLPS